MSIDVMKQALHCTRPGAIVPVTPETVKILVDALRIAIEQAERQEPVAYLPPTPHQENALYTAPPQQERQEPVAWQGLTREETVSLARQHLGGMPIGREFVDAVEALLREKNTAPPQRQPLTEEEIELLALKHAPPIHPDFTEDDDFIEFARAIERKHGIGGGE
jgi:hypothetical protein